MYKWKPKPHWPSSTHFLTHPRSSLAPPTHLFSSTSSLMGCEMSDAEPTLTHIEPTCTEKLLSVRDNSDASVIESMSSDVLKTLSALCLISSFFFSEPYLTGLLCGETNLFLFWIFLTFVISVLDLFIHVYFLCTWVPLSFDINESLLLIKKKKKKGFGKGTNLLDEKRSGNG